MTSLDGTRPLSELSLVPWSTLRHAYGVAIDVPEMIRTLADASDTTDIADAEHRLWCSLLYQGTIHGATAAALPFLLGLMAERPDIRAELSDWLGDLRWVLDDDATDGPVAECRTVLEQCAAAVTTLLDDPSEWVRSIGAGFLGGYRDGSGEIATALRERFAVEKSDDVRADLLLSMATLAATAGDDASVAADVQAWWKSDSTAHRCASAHARCILDPADREARAYLASCLPNGRPLGSWWGSGFPAFILETLRRGDGGLGDPDVLDVALTSLENSGPVAAAEILEHLLDEIFPDGHLGVPRAAADLTLRQRHVIEALATGRVRFTTRHGEAVLVHVARRGLSRFLLPYDRHELRRWLDGADRVDCVPPYIRERILRYELEA